MHNLCVSTLAYDVNVINFISFISGDVEQKSKFLWWDKDSFASKVDRRSSLAVHAVPRELSAQVRRRLTAGDGRRLYVAATAARRPPAHWRVLSAGVRRETAVSLLDAASWGPAAKHEVGRQPQGTVHCYRWSRLICSHIGSSAF